MQHLNWGNSDLITVYAPDDVPEDLLNTLTLMATALKWDMCNSAEEGNQVSVSCFVATELQKVVTERFVMQTNCNI